VDAIVERIMYASRWLLAPIYIGLSLALVALGIKFFQEIFHVLPHVIQIGEADLVLVVLSLIDIALVAGLIIMVMFTSYENFVSRIDLSGDTEKLSWLGTLDTNTLKSKVAASIVAISSIHLLKIFVNAANVENDKLLWYVLIHLTFVISAVAMGLLDKSTRKH
jgi:uncharacterized protein (TIGR00645 family)